MGGKREGFYSVQVDDECRLLSDEARTALVRGCREDILLKRRLHSLVSQKHVTIGIKKKN